MNLIKKILAIFIGFLIAFFISEIVLSILFDINPLSCKYNSLIKESVENNPLLKEKDFIKWAYVDIHAPFFGYDNNTFFIQRQDIWKPRQNNKKYSVNKDKKKKRIFILGESVARLYPENILEKQLLKYFDDAEVINVGMSGYDSYRIEQISKEIKSLSPDYVIVCIGNNDGIYEYNGEYIDPLDINWLPYKYSLLQKSKVIFLLSKLICPEKKLTKYTVEKNFQNNILKIINNLKETNIIFCDLPNNEYYRESDICGNIKQMEDDKEYKSNIWNVDPAYRRLIERIDFIKQIVKKYDNVDITNLTDVLSQYTNDKLDFNAFTDDCHFTQTTYLLLSKIITKIIVKKEKNLDINLDISNGEYLYLSNRDIVLNLIKLDIYYSYYSVLYEYVNVLFKNDRESFHKICNQYCTNFEINKDFNLYNKIVAFADVLQNNKEIKQSKEILNNLIKLVPDNFEAYLILGYIEYKNNNFYQADKYFSKAKELNKDSYIDVGFLKSLKEKN